MKWNWFEKAVVNFWNVGFVLKTMILHTRKLRRLNQPWVKFRPKWDSFCLLNQIFWFKFVVRFYIVTTNSIKMSLNYIEPFNFDPKKLKSIENQQNTSKMVKINQKVEWFCHLGYFNWWLKSIRFHHRPLIKVRIRHLILNLTERRWNSDSLEFEQSTIRFVGLNRL